jgi:hypothetical protein
MTLHTSTFDIDDLTRGRLYYSSHVIHMRGLRPDGTDKSTLLHVPAKTTVSDALHWYKMQDYLTIKLHKVAAIADLGTGYRVTAEVLGKYNGKVSLGGLCALPTALSVHLWMLDDQLAPRDEFVAVLAL